MVVLPRLWALYLTHGWLPARACSALPATIGLGGLYALWMRLSERPLYDLELVKEKLSRPAARAELRLVVFAPELPPRADVQAQAGHICWRPIARTTWSAATGLSPDPCAFRTQRTPCARPRRSARLEPWRR